MASTASSLRICLRKCRQLPTVRAARPALATRALVQRRALSSTPVRRADEEADADDTENVHEVIKRYYSPGEVLKDMLREEGMSEGQKMIINKKLEEWNQLPVDKQKEFEDLKRGIVQSTAQIRFTQRPKKDSFWNSEEKDSDLITDEIAEDDFEEDDILSIGHAKLEEHREAREYARIAVWEMPLLSKFAKPFVPPTEAEPLRFRYTTFMGEFHPADRKVVVEFSPKDLKDLTEAQQLKLMKLVGPRYNPGKELVKMSCDRFEHQAQNKRYLGDLVEKMIAAAKDPTDMFEDIPLDTRHHHVKVRPKFPKEWRMTEERRTELEGIRKKAFSMDDTKRKLGALVDGKQIIQAYLDAPPPQVAEPAMARKGPPQRPGRPAARRPTAR